MGNALKTVGCSLLIGLLILGGLFTWLAQNPSGWFAVIIVGIVIFFVARAMRRSKWEKIFANFENNAAMLDRLADLKDAGLETTFALQPNEKPLFRLLNTHLAEFQGVGSTVIAVGDATFTNQRIVFSGATMVREWDFKKVVSFTTDVNGYNVRIGVSGMEQTSGLQTVSNYDLGPGYPADYAYTWFKDGEAAAKKYLHATAEELRRQVKVERGRKRYPEKPGPQYEAR